MVSHPPHGTGRRSLLVGTRSDGPGLGPSPGAVAWPSPFTRTPKGGCPVPFSLPLTGPRPFILSLSSPGLPRPNLRANGLNGTPFDTRLPGGSRSLAVRFGPDDPRHLLERVPPERASAAPLCPTCLSEARDAPRPKPAAHGRRLSATSPQVPPDPMPAAPSHPVPRRSGFRFARPPHT
jgi:hypothetical protein